MASVIISAYNPSGFPSLQEEEPVKVEVLDKEGTAELLTINGCVFLRVEDIWREKVEYLFVDFQAVSVKTAMKRLGKEQPDGEDAEFTAMLAAEKCILHKAETGKLGVEADSKWQKYLKLKELSLRPGTPAEGIAAVKAALRVALEMAL